MNLDNINSKEYWENRFQTDWSSMGGNSQTLFFAQVATKLLPDCLIHEITDKHYSITDYGCAEGEGTGFLHAFFGVPTSGIDFSDKAIQVARENNSGCEFKICDIITDDLGIGVTDIAFCSNVLEHLAEPWKIAKKMSCAASRYLIILVPFREKLHILEHCNTFDSENIPLTLGEMQLVFVNKADCSLMDKTFYPDQQIMLVYCKPDTANITHLSDITDCFEDNNDNKLLINTINESVQKLLEDETHEQERIELKVQNNSLSEQNQALQKKNETYRIKLENMQMKFDEISENLKQRQEEFDKISESLKLRRKEQERLKEDLRKNQNDLEKKDSECRRLSSQNELLVSAIKAAKKSAYQINATTPYRVVCTAGRFINQFILGDMEDKKNFNIILGNALARKKSEFTKNDGYNAILNIIEPLEQAERLCYAYTSTVHSTKKSNVFNRDGDQVSEEYIISLPDATKKELSKQYSKPDVIILSVIDYAFRFQRPQQFASRFAENGYRVFYVNANFLEKEGIKEISNDLYVVNFRNSKCNAIYYSDDDMHFKKWFAEKINNIIFEFAIRDALVIVDYPNWGDCALMLKKTRGFRVITDYMDDYLGFLSTTTDKLRDNCIRILSGSDEVIASSDFLYNIASKYSNKVAIVRNGTEYSHFNSAFSIRNTNGRPIIGYYGAVSHWFDFEKVCFLAERMPQCDIVIIGEITENENLLRNYSNIKLLGEINYRDLPKYLAQFDVCLIPFDTSTDLIKATNPVKFYEYLSAGKKIVATDIPELEPFRNRYVYMANDNETFLDYVRKCIEHKDQLASAYECTQFAKKNDWQIRFEDLSKKCMESFPMVSIVVLTYNNLKLNKFCIDSIVNKTAYPNYELIIVDNMSNDGTVDYLRGLQKEGNPHIKIFLNDKNSGFAGGNNIGIKKSKGKYIVLLNNDTVVTRGWLTAAVKHLEQDYKCGMVGAVTNSIGNEAMIPVNYHNLTELDQWAYMYTYVHNNEEYKDVDRLAMFCVVIRREIIENFGLLDERYGLGMFEDDDYANTVRRAGYTFYTLEDMFVHHVNNASFKKLNYDDYKALMKKNRKLYEEKWNVKWTMPNYRGGVNADTNKDMMKEPVY